MAIVITPEQVDAYFASSTDDNKELKLTEGDIGIGNTSVAKPAQQPSDPLDETDIPSNEITVDTPISKEPPPAKKLIPVSVGELYADIIRENDRLNNKLLEAKNVPDMRTLDSESPSRSEEVSGQSSLDNELNPILFNRSIVDRGDNRLSTPEVAAVEEQVKAEKQKLQIKAEDRYAVYASAQPELKELRKLKQLLSSATDPVNIETLEKQIETLQKKFVAKGVVYESSDEAAGSPYFIPVQIAPPTDIETFGTADTILKKSVSNMIRGMELTIGVTPELATPIVRDDRVAVNFTSDLAPIVVGGFSLSKVISGLFSNLFKNQKLLQYAASTLGPALGEAILVTEDTGTLAEDTLFDEDELTAAEKKIAIISEALLLDATLQTVVKMGGVVTSIPYLGGILRAIPTLFTGSKKGAEKQAGAQIRELIALAENATTPLAKADSMRKLRELMSVNFESQTGVPFNRYLAAVEEDVLALAEGVDADVIKKAGAVAILELDFVPTTANLLNTRDPGVVGSAALMKQLGSGVEAATPVGTAGRARQNVEVQNQLDKLPESVLPSAAQIQEQIKNVESQLDVLVEEKRLISSTTSSEGGGTPLDKEMSSLTGGSPPKVPVRSLVEIDRDISRKLDEIDALKKDLTSPPGQPAKQAEEAGREAQNAIAEVLNADIAELEAEVEFALKDLATALEQEKNKLTVTPISSRGDGVFRATDNASDDAADVVVRQFKSGDNLRKLNYDDYNAKAATIEVEAAEYEELLASIPGDDIADVQRILTENQYPYSTVLKELNKQTKNLEKAIDRKIEEATEKVRNNNRPLDNASAQDREAYFEMISEAREEAREALDIPSIKQEIGYQEVKLSNIEGLLQAVTAELRVATGAEKVALAKLSGKLEDFVLLKIADNLELLELRNGANEYFQSFQALYKFIPTEVKGPLKYGDNIEETFKILSDSELLSVQDGFNTLLNATIASKPNRVAQQNISNIRESLKNDPKSLSDFDEAISKFYTNKIYGEEIKADINQIMTETDPIKVAKQISNISRRIRETLDLKKYSYLNTLSPNIRTNLLKVANDLESSTVSIVAKKEALQSIEDRIRPKVNDINRSPESEFSDVSDLTSAVNAAKALILNPTAGKKFAAVWKTAGRAGEKGTDGLTKAQQDLRVVIAQGITSMLTTPSSTLTGELSKLNANTLVTIMDSDAFKVAFPDKHPTRKSINRLAAQFAGLESRQAGKQAGESVTGSLQQAQDLVKSIIRFKLGALNKEAIQTNIAVRLYYKLVGGQTRMKQTLVSAFMEPSVAAKVLKDQETIMRESVLAPADAYAEALGRYLLQRVGITTIAEYNSEVQSFVLEEETNEILNSQ